MIIASIFLSPGTQSYNVPIALSLFCPYLCLRRLSAFRKGLWMKKIKSGFLSE